MQLLEAPSTPNALESLKSKIADRSALVGVVGVGYVGLPLAVEKAKVGFTVVGYDRNPIRVDQIRAGLNYIRDVSDRELAEMVELGRLKATTSFDDIANCDVIVICVPTPVTVNLDPDISYIRSVGELIAQHVRRGQLVCLESTTYPGTTEEVLLPLLSKRSRIPAGAYPSPISPNASASRANRKPSSNADPSSFPSAAAWTRAPSPPRSRARTFPSTPLRLRRATVPTTPSCRSPEESRARSA